MGGQLKSYKEANHDGYLRAHHLGTDHDQADITADGNPHWKPNIKGGLFGLFPSWEENKRETTFYLGLFY